MEMQNSPLGEIVRRQEQLWTQGNIQVSKYVTEDFYEDINKIEAYLNSKHTSSDTDNLGREKPFFNIVLAARNIWFRATDVDRKNIRAKAKKAKDLLASYIYTIHLQKWMKDDNFGKFLNDWGLYLASFNSAVCKFVEKKDGLHASVMDWNKMIVDVIDFDSGLKIEILELTASQLRARKDYDKELVEKVIQAKTARKLPDRMAKDQKEDYVRLYEVHGKMPLSYLTGNPDDEEEVQQMHVITFLASKGNGRFDDYALYSGREKQDPYLLTWLIPNVDGSISLNGSVKQLFEAQWMQNHTVKLVKDQLDLASKLIFQTSDPTFANTNALSQIESGQILVWNDLTHPNGQLTQLANNSHDITSLQDFGNQWKMLAQEITSTPDVMSGANFPSGTAYRQAVIVQQEAYSNFKIMIQNKGLFIEEMMRRWITPYILKQMDTTEEIVATLDAYGIDKIDERYIQTRSNETYAKKLINEILTKPSMDEVEVPDMEQEKMNAQGELDAMGEQRFLKPSEISTKTWKECLKEFEADVQYEITNENVDKQATFDTLNSVFQTLAGMQGRPMTPEMKIVWNKILSEAGNVSPIELNSVKTQEPQAQPPVGQGSGAMPQNINQMQPTQ